jgi:hypothetical protein
MEKISKRSDFSYFGLKPEHGNIEPTKQAWFDGYSIGDRLLEGVKFICTVLDDGTLSVEVHERHRSYVSDLNEEKWLTRALDYAMKNHMFTGMDGKSDLGLITTDGKYSFEESFQPNGIDITEETTAIPIAVIKGHNLKDAIQNETNTTLSEEDEKLKAEIIEGLEELKSNPGLSFDFFGNNFKVSTKNKDLKMAQDFIAKVDEEEGENWSDDYQELPKRMLEFAKLYHEAVSSKNSDNQ